MTQLVLGKQVTLAAVPGRDDRDHYGRYLRYIEVDGTDVGRTMVESGWGHAQYDGIDSRSFQTHPRRDDYRALDAAANAPAPLDHRRDEEDGRVEADVDVEQPAARGHALRAPPDRRGSHRRHRLPIRAQRRGSCPARRSAGGVRGPGDVDARGSRLSPLLREAFRQVRVSAFQVEVNALLRRELGRCRMLVQAEGLISPNGDER